jgi:HAD superfamily hydrolase (TIGR01458 family)
MPPSRGSRLPGRGGRGDNASVTSVEGVLLDVDGVLTVSWRALPGAAETVGWLREQGVPFLLATNASSMTRVRLADTLRGAGIAVGAEDLVTAPAVAGEFLRRRHPGAGVFQVGGRAAREDLQGVRFVDEDGDVVLVAGADEDFTWERLDRAFRILLGGAALVAMHRNLSWMTDRGPTLDAGAFVAGLELAAGTTATVTGKPSPDFFASCVSLLGLEPERVAMVGDDLDADVLAAQRSGLMGVLVRTGKFRQETLEASEERPDLIVDSIADLPEALG